MEDLQDSSFSVPSAMSIADELKDDFYFNLLDDFLGSQTGESLELDEKLCTNRLLVQVGVLREDNNASWVNITKWLQKIFPVFQSADFRGLIERNTETAMSLTGDARESFFASNVNFEFVGPICDSIGISRPDLLEMSDFSDRAKLTEVTNGLILELTSFIEREKLDPVVLVSWLCNFDPAFCSDGKIHKANKLLQASLERFRMQCRKNQTRRYRSSGLYDEFLRSPFHLISDLKDDSEYRSVSVIKGHLKRKRLHVQRIQNIPLDKIKDESESFNFSYFRPEYNPKPHCYTENSPKLECDNDSDQTFQPREVKKEDYHCQPAEPKSDLEDKTQVDTGDCLSILDVSVLSLQKLTEMYGGRTDGANLVSMDLLKNQYALMLKEDLSMQSLNEKVLAYNSAGKEPVLPPPLNFLHCNTHFLLNFIDAVEKQIMSFEREIVNTTGDQLGRDKNPKFNGFLNFNESAVTRYINMACEILCPRGESNNNYRRHWLAFCIERKNPSRLPVNQSNRFINYFEAAAALVHHYSDVALFVSDLQLLKDDANIFLESINSDASDEAIQALVCVVAVVYCKVLGPFWQLLKSDAQYVLFSKYLYCLYEKLLEWSRDASVLLQPEAVTNVFLQVPMQENSFPGVFSFCHRNANNQYGALMKECLQRMMKFIAAVMEENLKDFLPGGKYCKDHSGELMEQFASCTLSQLMGEYPFGHAYSYNKNRPDKSQVQPEGNTEDHSDGDGVIYRAPAVKKRSKPYVMFDRANLRPLNKLKKKRKLNKLSCNLKMQDQKYRKTIIASVTKNGGPCKSIQDVDQLLLRMEGAHHSQKREAVRSELNYQKFVVGCRDKRLNRLGFSLSDLVNKLKAILPCDNQSTSLVTEPTGNVVGGEASSGISQFTPQEQTVNQPSSPSNNKIDINNKDN
ncbi:solute carrier family 52, riboflavin transporter, member 2 isoform X1 [Tachysurus fulvidraco]|uniref:solute carrier family 52, riboflavin transporter, member 2 isoform X1 n=1 Tax=Tachysurus fulvidraco TaxID=1234273 RepID=UPI000F50EB4B|nr:solute carrier family 52, riboflavin transporter, member 2 isoform X1 [Tachysurus fulvidraco]